MPVVRCQGLTGAVEQLAAGGVVVYPTETYYGLGSLLEAAPVDRIVRIKGREQEKALPVLVGSREMVGAVAAELPPQAMKLADHFWPGPLTLVLTAIEGLPAPITAGSGTVGVRVSSHPLAAQLSMGLGKPIVATSANPAGMPAPIHLGTAVNYFRDGVEGYLEGGVLRGRGSTVVKVEREGMRLIRPGAIAIDLLKKVLPDIYV